MAEGLRNRLYERLSSSQIVEVDQIAAEFEASLSVGKIPSVSGILGGKESSLHEALLFELLTLMMTFRDDRKETAVLQQEMLHQFPEYSEVIQGALNQISTDELNLDPEKSIDVLDQKYSLIEEIGSGGFGTVYRAQQMRPIVRQVAVKMLREGLNSKEVIARFKAERQVLSNLDHPNVAKIFDGGDHAGRPYIAMELIRGIPVTTFADDNRLTIDQRINLVAGMCRGVIHSHMKGVIHRDLKPSNILVTELDGKAVPKIIDFGVAKILEKSTLRDSIQTGFWQIMGTIEYASPEQLTLSAVDVDIRSDVFSLGVILYELVVGVKPVAIHELSSKQQDEIIAYMRENPAPSPRLRLTTTDCSRRDLAKERNVTISEHEHLVSGELEWIIMKAINKDRSQRYSSAKELLNDLERFLNNAPVTAAPPSRWYRIKKYAQRHKTTVITTLSIFAALVIATCVSGYYAFVAIDQREKQIAATDIATQRADEAEQAIAEKETALLQAQLLKRAAQRNEIEAKNYSSAIQVRRAWDLLQSQPSGVHELLYDERALPVENRGFSWHYMNSLVAEHEKCVIKGVTPDYGSPVRWSPDGEKLYFLRNGDLIQFEIDDGTTLSLTTNEDVWNFSVSHGGSTILYTNRNQVKQVGISEPIFESERTLSQGKKGVSEHLGFSGYKESRGSGNLFISPGLHVGPFLLNDTQVIISSYDEIILHDLVSHQKLASATVRGLRDICVSNDDQFLAASTLNETVVLGVLTLERIASQPFGLFSPPVHTFSKESTGSRWLLSGSSNAFMAYNCYPLSDVTLPPLRSDGLWKSQTHKYSSAPSSFNKDPQGMIVMNDNQWCIINYSSAVVMRDIYGGSSIPVISHSNSEGIFDVSLSPKNNRLAITSLSKNGDSQQLSIFPIKIPYHISKIRLPLAPSSVALTDTQNGRFSTLNCNDPSVNEWQYSELEQREITHQYKFRLRLQELPLSAIFNLARFGKRFINDSQLAYPPNSSIEVDPFQLSEELTPQPTENLFPFGEEVDPSSLSTDLDPFQASDEYMRQPTSILFPGGESIGQSNSSTESNPFDPPDDFFTSLHDIYSLDDGLTQGRLYTMLKGKIYERKWIEVESVNGAASAAETGRNRQLSQPRLVIDHPVGSEAIFFPIVAADRLISLEVVNTIEPSLKATMFSLSSGEKLKEFQTRIPEIDLRYFEFSVSNDFHHFAIAIGDSVQVWRLSDFAVSYLPHAPSTIKKMAVSNGGQTVVLELLNNKQFLMWSVGNAGYTKINFNEGKNFYFNDSLCWGLSPNGNTIGVTSKGAFGNSSLGIIDLKTESVEMEIKGSFEGTPEILRFSEDGASVQIVTCLWRTQELVPRLSMLLQEQLRQGRDYMVYTISSQKPSPE
ncbi:Serine/threonine-protein kinase PknB [Thalassoglobus neptunius]|uniref:Serine/threonine-protein kinase PknB n=1 Tax=Thalassoglobus neptunius TaxID=1938619 RepID=A0A5C5V9R7_9PLAN|nr:serine/threonine-protein kinase [Thalassoglobus neptunius]TWT35031.1 Serine/threonine-protein kinase PknB [Thalassoglobus neptunius]